METTYATKDHDAFSSTSRSRPISLACYLGEGLPPELTCEIAFHLPRVDFFALRQASRTVNAHIHKPFVKMCAVERGTVEISLTKPGLRSFQAISAIREVALQVEKLHVRPERPSTSDLELLDEVAGKARHYTDEATARNLEEAVQHYRILLDAETAMRAANQDTDMLATAMARLENLQAVRVVDAKSRPTSKAFRVWPCRRDWLNLLSKYHRDFPLLHNPAFRDWKDQAFRRRGPLHIEDRKLWSRTMTDAVRIVVSASAASSRPIASLTTDITLDSSESPEDESFAFNEACTQGLATSLATLRVLELWTRLRIDNTEDEACRNVVSQPWRLPRFLGLLPKLEELFLVFSSDSNIKVRGCPNIDPLLKAMRLPSLRSLQMYSFHATAGELVAMLKFHSKSLRHLSIGFAGSYDGGWKSFLEQTLDIVVREQMPLDEIYLSRLYRAHAEDNPWVVFSGWNIALARFKSQAKEKSQRRSRRTNLSFYVEGREKILEALPQVIREFQYGKCALLP